MENITAEEYLKSLDKYNSVFDTEVDYEYSERQLIEFSDEFAKVKTSTLQAELEKAKQELHNGSNQYALVVVELEKAKELLDESRLQIEYLNKKFKATGTSNSLLSRLTTFLEAK